MKRRRLQFATFDALIDDIDDLRACGYDRAGNWDLAHVCEHLTRFMRLSLDGFPPDFRFALPLRVIGSTVVKWTTLATGWIPAGVKAPHPSLEVDEDDVRPEATAASHCIATIREVRDHEGPFHPSPLFGRMPPEQWRRVHLIHAAHHLSFLIPRR
jgi:hypothetical protein